MTIRIHTGYRAYPFTCCIFYYFYTELLFTVHFMQGGICGYYSQTNVQSFIHYAFLVDAHVFHYESNTICQIMYSMGTVCHSQSICNMVFGVFVSFVGYEDVLRILESEESDRSSYSSSVAAYTVCLAASS